jgi:hypothetical protein
MKNLKKTHPGHVAKKPDGIQAKRFYRIVVTP